MSNVGVLSELGRVSLFVKKIKEQGIKCDVILHVDGDYLGVSVQPQSEEHLSLVTDMAKEIWKDDDWDIG